MYGGKEELNISVSVCVGGGGGGGMKRREIFILPKREHDLCLLILIYAVFLFVQEENIKQKEIK